MHSQEDVDAIHDVAAVLAPLVPTLTDAVYNHLFSYVTTKVRSGGLVVLDVQHSY
jgi:hypothetical protein